MSERYVPLAEVKELLIEESKKRELLTSQKSALEHAQKVSCLSLDDTKKLIEELKGVKNVSDALAVKLADILPKYPADVRAVFHKERIELTAQDVQDILGIIAKYIN